MQNTESHHLNIGCKSVADYRVPFFCDMLRSSSLMYERLAQRSRDPMIQRECRDHQRACRELLNLLSAAVRGAPR